MQITVVAVVCHTLAALPNSPVCHEEIIVKDDMSMEACMIAQPAVADWKEHSIYRGPQWSIARVKCIPGEYVPRDAI